MKCPVCKTECYENLECHECGFEFVSTVFLSKQDGEEWMKNKVLPWRYNYWKSLKDFTIEDTTLIKYSGNDTIVVVPYGVTEIVAEAFSKKDFDEIGERKYVINRDVKEIYLPDSVTVIGENAFWACEGLEIIHLPKNLTVISKGAFGCCESLKSISIPATVSSIAEDAFVLCDKLEEIVVDSENSVFCSKNNCLIDKTTGILIQACSGSSIPQDCGVCQIAGLAFNQKKIVSVSIPEGVIKIEGIVTPNGKNSVFGAFYTCDNLVTIEFPNSLEYIASSAFEGCSQLKKIHIPQNVSYIGCGAFAGCNSVIEITVDIGNKNYYVRDNCLIDSRRKEIIAAFPNCTIPDDGSVTHIAKMSFYCHERCNPLFIPNTITHIADGAFEGGEYDIYCEVEQKPRTWDKRWDYRFGYEGKTLWNCSNLMK